MLSSALLTDFYQLTMAQAYLEERMTDVAVFELFVRKLPESRNFLVAAGLDQVLQYLEHLRFSPSDIEWLARQGRLSNALLDYLGRFRFEGDVHAMPEGSVFFANEPIVRITAPLPQAQLVESRVLNLMHFQTLIASKAARMRLVAGDRRLVDFGMRRAHGAEAALLAARAAWLTGFDGTATAEAGRAFAIPVFGTMAHSFVQTHASEQDAFAAFARVHPQRPTLLVDTYDTETGVAHAIALAREGVSVAGVRLDSGDLGALAKSARRMLDDAGLRDVTILASGNLDEYRIAALLASEAPIDAFGIGTALDTSIDTPALDAVYKVQSYAGIARRKRSTGKATWPGVKQVWRSYNADGCIARDVIQLDGVSVGDASQPQLALCMRGGRRIEPWPGLHAARARCARELATLPAALKRLTPADPPFSAVVSPELQALAREIDARRF
ncbi:MAG TPA: nicotinate phosphoribosyltransferase [Burkholderiaceae bacterium]|nr:nicotinate phosphoribosyltransferase [Burkholderiaceae bacterium]